MIKITIILFFTILFLNLTGQSKIDGQWGLQDHRNLIFTFEDSSKLLIEGENSQNGSLFPQEFEINIENSLIILKSNNDILDTFSVLELNSERMVMVQKSTLDTLKFFSQLYLKREKELKRISEELKRISEEFMNNEILDIEINRKDVKRKLRKRKLGLVELNKKRNCLEELDYRIFYEKDDHRVILKIKDNFGPHSKKSEEINILINEIKADTLFGELLKSKSKVRIVINEKSSKSSNDLIGNYILLEDKSDLEKILKRKTQTIFIGHIELTIMEGNKCRLSGSTFSSTGEIHYENIEGVEYFSCYNINEREEGFLISKNIIKKEKEYLILSPLFCRSIPTMNDDTTNTESYNNGVLEGHKKHSIDKNLYLKKID